MVAPQAMRLLALGTALAVAQTGRWIPVEVNSRPSTIRAYISEGRSWLTAPDAASMVGGTVRLDRRMREEVLVVTLPKTRVAGRSPIGSFSKAQVTHLLNRNQKWVAKAHQLLVLVNEDQWQLDETRHKVSEDMREMLLDLSKNTVRDARDSLTSSNAGRGWFGQLWSARIAFRKFSKLVDLMRQGPYVTPAPSIELYKVMNDHAYVGNALEFETESLIGDIVEWVDTSVEKPDSMP